MTGLGSWAGVILHSMCAHMQTFQFQLSQAKSHLEVCLQVVVKVDDLLLDLRHHLLQGGEVLDVGGAGVLCGEECMVVDVSIALASCHLTDQGMQQSVQDKTDNINASLTAQLSKRPKTEW